MVLSVIFFYRSGLAQRGTMAEAPFDLDNVKNAERQQVANDLGALKRRKSSSSVRCPSPKIKTPHESTSPMFREAVDSVSISF